MLSLGLVARSCNSSDGGLESEYFSLGKKPDSNKNGGGAICGVISRELTQICTVFGALLKGIIVQTCALRLKLGNG